MPTDPVFLQHLINLIGQKGPNNREPKSQTKSPNLKSESPKLPSSTDLPSPCFNNKETNLKPNSSTETLLHSFSSSNSSNFLREDEVQIDVETTTDDDEQTAEQHGAGNESKILIDRINRFTFRQIRKRSSTGGNKDLASIFPINIRGIIKNLLFKIPVYSI